MPIVEKVKFAKGREIDFKHWIHQELNNTFGDRQEKEREWKDYLDQWRAKLSSNGGVTDFPWPGASDIEFPLTAMHTDPVYADLMQSYHASREFWYVDPIHANSRADSANALREALAVLDRDFLKMRQVNQKGFLYNILLGTNFYKTHWYHDSKLQKGYDAEGSIVDKRIIVSQPRVESVPINHIYVPADAWSLDPDVQGGARWIAQRFDLTVNQLLAKARAPDPMVEPPYDAKETEMVAHFVKDREDNLDEFIQGDLEQYSPYRDRKITLYEVHARFDVDNDGFDEDIVVIYHYPTDKILRVIYNTAAHGKRPYQRIRYLENFGIYGIGAAEVDQPFQVTMSQLLNGQINNVILANTRMYSAPLGSNITPGAEIYPSKVWMVGPGEQVGEIRMGDIYPSLPQTMVQLQQWSESRSGVSELRQGNLTNLPSRTPASTTLSLLAESNKKFSEIMSSMRGAFSEMGLQVIQLMSQYLIEDPDRWTAYFVNTLGKTDAEKVLEILASPIDRIGEQYGIVPTATSSVNNKEADKQNFVGLMQLVSQIYPQLVQTALLIQQVDPNSVAGKVALASYTGGVELLKQLLERFDIQNPEQYLPIIPELTALQQQQALQAEQAGQIQPQFSPLGGFFGPGPFAQGSRQVGGLLGL